LLCRSCNEKVFLSRRLPVSKNITQENTPILCSKCKGEGKAIVIGFGDKVPVKENFSKEKR
jgi:hypothetical protein